jgi:hypothetical protein
MTIAVARLGMIDVANAHAARRLQQFDYQLKASCSFFGRATEWLKFAAMDGCGPARKQRMYQLIRQPRPIALIDSLRSSFSIQAGFCVHPSADPKSWRSGRLPRARHT